MLKNDAYIGFKDSILSGRLRPGQFVTQKELCDLIGVPIAPAREAIQRLEHEMLLKVYPKRGIQISSISPQFIRNSYQVRLIIEKEGLRSFVETADIENINQLLEKSQALLEKAEASQSNESLAEEWVVLDTAFHDSIVQCLDNEILSQTYQINQARIRLIRLSNRQTGDQNLPAMREHLDILTACHDRELIKAEQLLDQHILASQRRAMDGC